MSNLSKEVKLQPVEGEIKSRAKRPARRLLTESGKMRVPSIPGYYTRFVNTDTKDHPTRLQDFKDAWYEPVLRKELYGENCEDPNDIVRVNDPMQPILMKLPMDVRLEDLARKDRIAKEAMQKKTIKENSDELYGSVSISRD